MKLYKNGQKKLLYTQSNTPIQITQSNSPLLSLPLIFITLLHPPYSELFLASKEGNATWVKALLAAGADIDGRDGVCCVSVTLSS